MRRCSPSPATVRLGPASRAALQLLACCPRIPTDVLADLLGSARPRTTRKLLARLRTAGLAQRESLTLPPLLGSRTARLWSLTDRGQDVVAERGLGPSAADVARLPYGTPDRPQPATSQATPLLLAAYRALAALAVTMQPRPRVRAWEQPWARSFRAPRTGGWRHVRLPAAAVLEAGLSTLLPVVLLPDLGTAPVVSYWSAVARLIALREVVPGAQEPLVVVATFASEASRTRAVAWQALTRRVATRAGELPPPTQVLAWADGRAPSAQREAPQPGLILDLLARHPLLTRTQLAGLLGTSPARVARVQAQLVERGWLRPIAIADLASGAAGLDQQGLQRLGLVELTRAGRLEAARRLGLPGPQAARHHGHVGGRARARRRFLRHLAHTLGVNAVFVALARAARAVTLRGGDEALVDWRSAAASAHGRCRPDGYGCYRRGHAHYGFLLEYDRGTERAREYGAKLQAYYRYRDSGAAARDYLGFPTVLIVTTSERAEDLIAHQAHLAAERRGGTALPVLLTTTGHVERHADGLLGPVWRAPGPLGSAFPARAGWLPGGARGLP